MKRLLVATLIVIAVASSSLLAFAGSGLDRATYQLQKSTVTSAPNQIKLVGCADTWVRYVGGIEFEFVRYNAEYDRIVLRCV